MVRNILDLHRATDRFLIEPLSGHFHLKTMLMSRLVTFHKGLVNSPKFTVRFLARLVEKDMRTVLGKTLDFLRSQCGCQHVEDLSSRIVKENLTYKSASQVQTWQVSFAKELLGIWQNEVTVNGFSDDEIRYIFNHVCTA